MGDTFEKQVTQVEGVIRRLQQTFECPICLDLMNDPVSTKCDHKFCRLCLLQVLRPRNRAPCPICKESVTKRSLQVLPHWNAIVGKVAQLIEAFQRDTGCEFSAGGVQTYVTDHGWTDCLDVDGGVSHRVDGTAQLDTLVKRKNEQNSDLTRKRKAEGDMETVIYIEDVSQEASRPSNVKSHINISSAFAGSRCRKHRKTDCTKDVVDATTMDDRRECCQKQGVTVATGNTSSTTDVCVVDLVTTETRNNASNANDISQVNNDKDCVVIEDTKGVKKGRKSGNGSGRGQHCTKNVPRTSESELLVCLAEESLGQVSGHSAGSQTVIAQPNPRRSLRSFRSDIRGKEINLPTQRATRSKVMTRSMGDGVTLSNGRRSSRKGKENVNGIDRCVNKNREDTKIQTIPLDTNDNANFDDIHKVCPDANGVINDDKELGKCSFAFGLTCSDKTPEISSKVMTWLQTTADSVSPLSENIVVISEMKGSKTKSNNGGLVEDVSTQHDGGICTRSRGAQNDRRSSCGQPAVDVQKTAGRRSHGMEDLVSFVDRTHSAHQAKIRNADSADVTGIFKSPCVTKTMPCRAYGGIVSNVETKLADARNIGTREISRNASAKWIFQSGLDRSGKIDVNGITETDNASSVSQLDDPYLFIASPETPRRKKGRPKRGARQRNVTQKKCIDVVTISNKRGRNCGNGQKEIVESKDKCELSELVEKISEAESYDLLLSQQFRDMEQIARSEQQMELVSGWGEVPDGASERQHPAGKWGTRGEGHKVIGDSEMMYEISQAQQSCGVETLDAADKETMQGIPEKPCQLQGRCRDSPVVGDISGKVERESGMMQLRRKVAGNVFPKDYGRKCSREEGTDKSLKCVKETLSVVINTAAEPTVKALKTSRGKRKGRGKRSRLHWKKKKATSGGDERGDDAALIARQDEQVEPSGDTETEADVFVEGGAASLSCVSEYTLENVTNGSQSQGHTVNDSNDRCSKSIFGDTPCGKDHLLGGDVHCKNDLDLNNCYVNKGVKERIVSLSEYELDGIILVPARHGHFSKGSPNSVVVVESGSSDEDGLPCSNETSGFEPMQDFELHVNAKVKSPMAPLEVPALNDEDSCPIERIPHDSPSRSKTPERGLCTYFTHNALVTGSQKTIDDQDTLSYDVHQGNHSTCDLECQKESPENLEKSPQNETGDDSEKPTTEDQDTEVVGCDDICSLKSSRKTFSLNSSPLLRGPRESLELHNVLCEAAEMMQDTCGSVDPDLLERNSGHISPASSVSQKAPVFCTKREDTQNVPLDGVNSACKAVQKLSLKYGNHTTETSPKLLLNRIGPVCEKSQQDFGNKSDSRRKSRLLSPASKTKSTTSDHFSPTGETGDQTCSGRVIRKSTSRKPSTFGAGDFGEMFHSDSPTEICHPAEKSQRKVGKRKISRKRLGKGIEDSHGRVQCYAGSNVPLSGTLSGESESTLSAAAVVVKSVANLQMQPADRKADHLHSDTTFLSSDEVVLATTGASDDISPPIRVPYAASFKSSKNVRKKPRDKRMADSSQVAATTREGDLQNCHHVEMLHKEINTGKPRNPPTCERGIDTTEEYIKYRNDIEEANDRKGTGQTGVNVVMETMSCESNMSEESEESSSVLLSCIPPTMHEDTVPDQRVNDSRQGVATRDATQRVNGQIFANKKCTEDRGSSEQETEDGGEDSDGNTTEEEDFSTDILENKKTAVTEAQTGRGPSPRENQKKLPLKNVSADARAEINSYLQPPGGNADKAKIVKMVTLPLNVVCDASVSSDKSSMLNSSSVSKRHTGPRRRILARRSLWSQGSSESRDWLRTSQSTAASTPLIPLVKRQSCDTVDLGKNETAQGVSQKCVSDDGQISLPVESVPGENYVENITMETQAYVTEARKKRHNVRDSREGETRDGSGTGGGVGKRELEPLNEGDIHYSEMSTLDGAEVLQTEEDSASPCHNPRGKNGLGGSSSIVASSPTAGTDIHGGNDDTVLSSDTVKGQCRGGVHAMRGLASWQWSSPIGILATKERDTDRSSLESVRDDGKGIGESQTHSTGCSVNEGCHDNLVEDNEPICCHSNASTTDSNDKGDISCELQERCHSNNVTSDDSDESRCDTINDDISRTSTGHQQFDDDDSDVDDLVLPTPQKQKPILKVAMEIHSVVMDSSSDIEQSSLEGVGGMADTCEDVNGNSEDFTVKKEIQEGSTEPIPRHERETQPVTPSGNPKRTLMSLPTTPSQPVWVEDRDLGSQEEWERIRKNISDDLRFGKTDIPSPMTLNKPGGTGEVSEVEEVCQLDSDEEEEFVTLKRRTRKRQSVAELDSDSSETEDAPGGSTCCHGNMTSSSGLSSQSDLPITQCKQKLETEVKSLQEQILQMEAAIAAGDGCNHGNPSANGNHGDTVDCLSGSADRTMSEKVQCIPATSSGEAGSSKRMPSCYVTKSPCDGRPSRFYGMSSSGTSKKSARLSRSSSCHDNNVVNLVDSDDEETPSSEVRHIKVHRRQYSGNNDRTDTQKVDMCRSQVSAGCHSNGGNLMDEEEGCDSVQNEDVRCDSEENEDVDQCDGEENEDVDHCDSEENEDVDHGKDRRPENHTDVDDGEMEEGSCVEGEGGNETNDSGLDSDEDLFAPSEDIICIPQTITQEDVPVKPRYVLPLLTSTPRPSFDPCRSPPFSELQTADRRGLSTPPGADKMKHLDDEDILPSLEGDIDMVDESSDRGSTVKMFDNTCKSINICTSSNTCKSINTCTSSNTCCSSSNKTGFVKNGKMAKEQHNSLDCRRSSSNQNETMNNYAGATSRNSRQSVDVNRNGDENIDITKRSERRSMNSIEKKDLLCQNNMQMENKLTKELSPVMSMVAPPHRRCQKEAPSRGAVKDVDFPLRPGWVFIASGISKTIHQPGIDRLVRLLDSKFVSRYSPAVTHVLVNAAPPGSRRCARTLKYFQGVAGGKWVVNVHWALDSLTMQTLQPMKDYEISSDTGSDGTHNAPQRARCSSMPLLRKYEICCHGNFRDLTRDDLCGLVEACGAMTIQEPSMFTFDPNKVQVIIIEDSAVARMAELRKFQRRYQVALVQKEWLLDTISVYDIQPLEEYYVDGPSLK